MDNRENDVASERPESRILWAPLADAAMSDLEGDALGGPRLDAVRRVLGMLEADPGQAALRRKRFQNGLWAVMVFGGDDPWLVLWEPAPETRTEIVIRYLGPPPGG